MLNNYLKIALRTLRRHKGYTAINIAGLAIGIACCVLMGLFVQDELRYDRFHENADRIYRVNATSFNPEGDFYRTLAPPPLAAALQADYPEVEQTTRLRQQPRRLLRVDDAVYLEDRFFLAET